MCSSVYLSAQFEEYRDECRTLGGNSADTPLTSGFPGRYPEESPSAFVQSAPGGHQLPQRGIKRSSATPRTALPQQSPLH